MVQILINHTKVFFKIKKTLQDCSMDLGQSLFYVIDNIKNVL